MRAGYLLRRTMDVYWVPGVNNSDRYGRWAFADFTDVYEIEEDIEQKIEAEFGKLMSKVTEASEEVTSV